MKRQRQLGAFNVELSQCTVTLITSRLNIKNQSKT